MPNTGLEVRQDSIHLGHVPDPCATAELRIDTDTELLAEVMGRAAKLCTIHKHKVFLVASLQGNLPALSPSKLQMPASSLVEGSALRHAVGD